MSPLDSLCGPSERTHRHLDDGERLCRSPLVKVPVPSDEFVVGKKWKPREGAGQLGFSKKPGTSRLGKAGSGFSGVPRC